MGPAGPGGMQHVERKQRKADTGNDAKFRSIAPEHAKLATELAGSGVEFSVHCFGPAHDGRSSWWARKISSRFKCSTVQSMPSSFSGS